jgi:glycosyltransferase involved in cell wall biosynthesis
MKSVLVCAAQAPFVTGGAEIHVRELVRNLRRRDFRVDVVSVPFHGYPPTEVPRQSLAWRLLELRHTTGESVDLVIATKFPSYFVRHHRKVAWVFHQYREAYDLLGTEHSPLTDNEEDRRLVDTIRTMDRAALVECRMLFTNSKNVADRLARFSGLSATPLYPPPQQLGRYRCDGYGDFLLCPGRLDRTKRPELALRALAHSVSGSRLKLTGEGPLRRDLERLADDLGISQRVDFLGFVSEPDLVALYAACRAAFYAPLDEDYGYVTIEAFLSQKPVITATDSGGPLEFVEDGVSGFVAAPEARTLADAIDRCFGLPEARLREMGEEGRRRGAHIGWDTVVDRLTETIR